MSNNPHEPIFGVFIPQGWKMELAGIDGAENKWNKAVEIAVMAEELGFDSIWVYDHFHNVPAPAHEAVFECWTTMAAISQRTSRIRLGQMVGCNLYRPPSLLAKITSTLDVISGGRLDWGIGAGWYENECRGYGYPFPVPKDRIAMLREAVEIVRVGLPLVHPFRTVHGDLHLRDVLLVRVVTETGEGWGEVSALTTTGYAAGTDPIESRGEHAFKSPAHRAPARCAHQPDRGRRGCRAASLGGQGTG